MNKSSCNVCSAENASLFMMPIWRDFTFTFFILELLQIAVIPNCSILAAVGQKMASTPGVSATLFNALAKVGKLVAFSVFKCPI